MRVHLAIENTRERRTIRNVIGVLRGTDEPERQILLSNHHDAWVYGAVDPSSGTATMISLARALGTLARQGLRPRRTIVFGNWDAEEYTLTGSTEWGEEHEADLARNAVVCINVDASTSGRSFSASASPLAFAAIRETAADVADPGAPGKSVADTWRENAGKTNIRSYATDAGRPATTLPVAILGSGSDYTVFFNRLGMPVGRPRLRRPLRRLSLGLRRLRAGWRRPATRDSCTTPRWRATPACWPCASPTPTSCPSTRRRTARRSRATPRISPDGPRDAARRRSSRRSPREARRVERGGAGGAGGARRPAARRGLRRPPTRRPPTRGSSRSSARCSIRRASPDGPGSGTSIYAPLPSYAAETLPAIRERVAAGDLPGARAGIANLSRRLAAAADAARTMSGPGARP